ncbi:hypothetical protein D3C79_876890 [compost metagenome]
MLGGVKNPTQSYSSALQTGPFHTSPVNIRFISLLAHRRYTRRHEHIWRPTQSPPPRMWPDPFRFRRPAPRYSPARQQLVQARRTPGPAGRNGRLVLRASPLVAHRRRPQTPQPDPAQQPARAAARQPTHAAVGARRPGTQGAVLRNAQRPAVARGRQTPVPARKIPERVGCAGL